VQRGAEVVESALDLALAGRAGAVIVIRRTVKKPTDNPRQTPRRRRRRDKLAVG